MDFGNPRYAASRKSSFCGGLINGRHTLDGYYPLSNIGEKDAEKENEEDSKDEVLNDDEDLTN